jgi:hypothetical protein
MIQAGFNFREGEYQYPDDDDAAADAPLQWSRAHDRSERAKGRLS